MTPEPDRSSTRVWGFVVIVGIILAIIGWWRWMM
jgi:hypothetical protein